jgi:hypothetical protein
MLVVSTVTENYSYQHLYLLMRWYIKNTKLNHYQFMQVLNASNNFIIEFV